MKSNALRQWGERVGREYMEALMSEKPKPVRVYFLTDDVAELWEQGQTADDLGPESPGSNVRLLKLDHFDELVAIEDPYGRGLIARLEDSAASDTDDSRDEAAEKPEGFSDAELDEYLDSLEDDDEGR
jgi:hypothetical protein